MITKYTQDKVRDFELTEEDAALLAECFNSFDDTDSWPGGFTHGVPYTAERILEDKSKSRDIRTIVAYKDSKIVGHCNLTEGELDEEAAYVGLLGVSPQYQGQGFGRALLIEAAETAARQGKRRIDLHTWGGNLKALPLYKRTGYNWVPGTRVLMESHIPGILSCEVFREFFDRHYWYDSYKRTIRQEVDDTKEADFGVFRYHFEAEGDILDVTVDREAKGISGFSLTIDGQTFEVDVRPEKHVGYIGVWDVLWHLRIRNETGSSISISLDHTDFGGCVTSIGSSPPKVVENGSEVTLQGSYTLSQAAKHLDRELTPDEKVKTQVRWHVSIDEKDIDLFNGLVPQEAVSLIVSPRYPALAPNESREIGLGLKNNTNMQLAGRVIINTNEDSPCTFGFSLDPDSRAERTIHVGAPAEETLLTLPVTISIDEGDRQTIANRKKLRIPVIGEGGAYAYESHDNMYILENRQIRYGISAKAPMGGMILTNKPLSIEVPMWAALLPDVGYPFSAGGSEWEKKEFDVHLANQGDVAEITLEAESNDRPGLHLRIIYRLTSNSEHVGIEVEMINGGSASIENLGFLMRGWAEIECNDMYVPLRGDIYRLSSPEWNGIKQLPKNPNEYAESWCALNWTGADAVLGYIWDADAIADVRLRRTWGIPRFEYRVPDLEPDESIRIPLLRLMFSQGTWKNVRDLWGRLTGATTSQDSPVSLRSDLEVQILRPEQEYVAPGAPVFLDRARENKMELRVRVIHENQIDVNLKVIAPDGVFIDQRKEIDISGKILSIDKPLHIPLDVTVESDAWFLEGGRIELRFPNRVASIPLTAVVFDSDLGVTREEQFIEDMVLRTTRVGEYEITASPDYCGNLVRYQHTTESGVLYDIFPEAKPFIWWDKFYSGLTPVLAGYRVWDWMSAVPKESWVITDVTVGPWVGYELTGVLKYCPRLHGMTHILRYLLLPGTPLVHVQVTAHNTSGLTRRFRFGIRGATEPQEAPLRTISLPLHIGRTKVDMTENELHLAPEPEEGWAAIHNADGRVLGVVTTCKSRRTLELFNMDGKTQTVSITDERVLAPDQQTSLSCYLVMVSDAEAVEVLKSLPGRVE